MRYVYPCASSRIFVGECSDPTPALFIYLFVCLLALTTFHLHSKSLLTPFLLTKLLNYPTEI
jgi:hypothetical protein